MAQNIIPRIFRNPNVNMVHSEEAYSEPCETSKMERPGKQWFQAVNHFRKIIHLKSSAGF